MFWKTSCNADCFSLLVCCFQCLSQFLSVQSQKVMWSSGLYGHWVCQKRTAGQTSQPTKSLSISPALSMPTGACSKQLTHSAQRATERSGSFHCCPNSGLNHQRAAPPEQSDKYEHGLRDFCFFLLCRLDSETYHIPACAAQRSCALNCTFGNHGEMHGPISYE